MGQWHTSELLALQRPREEDVKFEVSNRPCLMEQGGREKEGGREWGLYACSWFAVLIPILKCKAGLEMCHVGKRAS